MRKIEVTDSLWLNMQKELLESGYVKGSNTTGYQAYRNPASGNQEVFFRHSKLIIRAKPKCKASMILRQSIGEPNDKMSSNGNETWRINQ